MAYDVVAQYAGDIIVLGKVIQGELAIPSVVSGALPQANLTQRDLQTFELPLENWLTNETNPVPPGAPGTGKLGLVRGTVGSDALTLQTTDCKAGGALSFIMLATHVLCDEYVTGESVQISVACKMITNPADSSATVDIEVFKDAGDGTVGSDICTTAAQSFNSVTPASKTFSLNIAGLAAGDKLHIRMTVAVNDAATGTAVIGCICRTKLLADIKG